MVTASITIKVSSIRTEENGTYTVVETTSNELLDSVVTVNFTTLAAAVEWIG